ncbi:MAG: threonine-phosphate decarboxylase, partial [Halanaerobiales bacterium]
MNLSYVNQIHGGNIEKAKDTYNLDEERILDFSANINFSGPPPGLMKELKDNMEKIIHYPESHSVGLTKKLASSLNISEDNLIIS